MILPLHNKDPAVLGRRSEGCPARLLACYLAMVSRHPIKARTRYGLSRASSIVLRPSTAAAPLLLLICPQPMTAPVSRQAADKHMMYYCSLSLLCTRNTKPGLASLARPITSLLTLIVPGAYYGVECISISGETLGSLKMQGILSTAPARQWAEPKFISPGVTPSSKHSYSRMELDRRSDCPATLEVAAASALSPLTRPPLHATGDTRRGGR